MDEDVGQEVTLHECTACDNRLSEAVHLFTLGKFNSFNLKERKTHSRHYKIPHKQVKYVEVTPHSDPFKKPTCQGPFDVGFPIIKLDADIDRLVFVQRIHEKTSEKGEKEKPACKYTHTVTRVIGRRAPHPQTAIDIDKFNPLRTYGKPTKHGSTTGHGCCHDHLDHAYNGNSYSVGKRVSIFLILKLMLLSC